MDELKFANTYSSAHVHALLQRQGHKPAISPAVLDAALEILDCADSDGVLQQAKDFFRSKCAMLPSGLDTLPPVWVTTLPEILWRTRKPHWEALPYMCRKVKIEDGVLCMKFAQELPTLGERVTAWDRLRVKINLELRPNLWIALPLELERQIWAARPELRSQLFQVAG